MSATRPLCTPSGLIITKVVCMSPMLPPTHHPYFNAKHAP
jgi:hypothetical protein